MPFVSITMREGTTPEHRKAISSGIHEAMIDVLGIPEDDLFHTILEQKPENMIYPLVSFGIERNERCMFITLHFNQRDAAEKKALFESIVAHLAESADVRREELFLCIVETGRENWWAAGRVVDPATGYDERMSAPSGR